MLIPEPRRTREAGNPTDPDSKAESPVRGREADPTVTVLRTSSGSSARRQQAQAGAAIATLTPLPSPGETIGSFLLEEAIGAGGMGAVFRALDTQLDRQVALKLLPPDQAVDPEVVRRFYQEGRSAAQLDHENIARVFSIGQDGLFHHIAFEYIEGVTLRHRVESTGPLKPAEAVDVALQIANALVHASRRGVVHRDIKPSNIILTPLGRAKVVDMGLARRFERGGDHGLTQSGMTLGTFDYISPEQARDPRDVDVRSDLYSLGCTMFHMLTGRPPFPGGTVLQKLIQHQEEAPADVGTLNPEVPSELSAIIAKLMAKERDRRYQGPEHLVRDLLALAGSLGLERPNTALEPWMTHAHHAWWERHLVWVLPALGFVVVIGCLGWWGREFSRPPAPGGTAQRPSAATKVAASPAPEIRTVAPESARVEADPADSPEYPQTIPVSSTEDLQAVLASAPRRSVIVLADDGPYRLTDRTWTARGSKPSAEPDLTIRAEAGVRPVLKRAEGVRSDDGRSASPSLLQFVGGHVLIEGVEFEVDAPASGSLASAVRCEDTELILRGCSFRRPDRVGPGNRDIAAVVVRAPRTGPRGAERPPAVFADSCHFDGGQAAVRARGPADITLRDCTVGPAGPSIWFDDARPDRSLPGELRLIHTSILAGAGPVFRFDGGPVRVRVDDCVIAAAGREPSALVQADDPRDLDWRGRSNLYGAIAPFLTTAADAPQPATVPSFTAWEQGASGSRELGSRVSDVPVWDAEDPLLAVTQERDNPTRVFLLGSRVAESSDIGARRGPFGSSLKDVRPAPRPSASPARPTELALNRADGPAKPDRQAADRATTATSPRPDPTRDRPARTPEKAPVSGEPLPPMPMPISDPMTLPSMPPMSTPDYAQPDVDPGDETTAAPMPDPGRGNAGRSSTAERAAQAPAVSVPAAATSDEDVIRSAEQFLTVLRHLGDRGGSMRIGSGVELDLPAVAVSAAAANRIQIVAEPGSVRPRLRFRPAPANGSLTADWIALLSLRSGSMRLQGLDLIVPEPEGLTADRLAAIAVAPGTELILDDCTITLAVRGATVAALTAQPAAIGRGRNRRADAAGLGAVIQVRNSFLRSGGDAVAVAGGVHLALKLEDTLVATEGSLLHASGSAHDPAAGSSRNQPLDVRIDRVCARLKGGLVHLQTTPEEPDMAAVDIRADNSILNTVTGDHPLFRLEGQDQLERLRDKIRWVGHKVAYHHIKTYRRDEIVQAGGLPRIYDRNDWTRAFLPTDDAPMLSDLKFRQQTDATVPAWKVVRDDLSLAANSTASPIGPDAEKVPDPPASDEEL